MIAKKPIMSIAIAMVISLLIFSLVLIACTAAKGEDNKENDLAVIVESPTIVSLPAEPKEVESIQIEPIQEEEQEPVKLLSDPVEDKICLVICTTENPWPAGYYILEDEAQSKLIPLMESLKKEPASEGIFKNRYSLGITIAYQGIKWELLSDGTLYYHDFSGDAEVRDYFAKDQGVFDTALQIAAEDLGIIPFDPRVIKDIESARLSFISYNNPDEIYTQTVTDSTALAKMEKLFSEGEILHGGAGCPFGGGILTLTLEDGQQIKLALATDSCCTYFVNGMYFKYKGGDNTIIFDYFHKIPIYDEY